MPLLRSPVLGCHPALAHVGPLVALAVEGTALLFKSVGVGRSDRRRTHYWVTRVAFLRKPNISCFGYHLVLEIRLTL